MKLTLVLLIVMLWGSSIGGNEPGVEQMENVLKSVLNEIKDLKMQNIDLEERVEKLEQLSKFKTLRTCQELASRGLTLSGLYEVDPDGEGIGPIEVFCDFSTNTTQILHDKEDMIKIDKCNKGNFR